jgi:hypothetical protein
MAGIYGSDKFALNNTIDDGSSRSGAIQVSGALIYPVIFTTYQLRKAEKLQDVEAFNENSHFYAFGRSASILMLAGHLLSIDDDDTSANKSLLGIYEKALRAFKVAESGDLVTVSGPSDVVFVGVADGIEFSAQSDIRSLFSFSLSLKGISQGFAVGGKSGGRDVSYEV